MARFAIGDIHGCYKSLMLLLAQIGFNKSRDVLYLTGDLVNRGPLSLKVLQWVYDNQDSVITVLGNHDIYLIARYANIIKTENRDTLTDVLQDKNVKKFIDWLRRCPLIFHEQNFILVHAGIYPQLDFSQILHIAHNCSFYLQHNQYKSFLTQIYGDKPNYWTDNLSQSEKMKFIINSCTRMRFLQPIDTTNFALDANASFHTTCALDYKFKGEISNKPANLIPWFEVKPINDNLKPILFGHWAALGFKNMNHAIALDSGCIWGQQLTAFNLDTKEITQVSYSDA